MKIVLFAFLLLALPSLSQDDNKREREKFPTSFAVQFRFLANNRVIESSNIALNNDTVVSSIGMIGGFSFGGIIRRQYTDNLGIEIGLNHNKRFYDLEGTVLATDDKYSTRYAFTNYELPVNGLAFIRFSEKFYANAGLGVSFIYKPSNVLKRIIDDSLNRSFTFEGYAFQKFNMNINAQFGLEYRTDKVGTFYFGGSASIPTSPLFSFISVYRSLNDNVRTDQGIYVRSPYFTIDIRYYFPKINNKGPQPNKGPIE